ncbi:hypothetical protein MKX01_025315 [Papaver californicum]|nr:hypothetical protein MKX01_025315 [Papaver californicum]
MAPQEVFTSDTDKNTTMKASFKLLDGNLSSDGITLLSKVPDNVSFIPFSALSHSSDASPSILQRVQDSSCKGGFLGLTIEESSDRSMNSVGKFIDRDFLTIFRFKTWWSTMWVGNNGSQLQMESQWLILDVPELKLLSYVLIMTIIEGKFRSALHPVKTASFHKIACVHISDYPYNLMKEAYSAIRVHMNPFKLLEEKLPIGVWHGVREFAKGGITLRFLIIDYGWQSISLDDENPLEDAKNLVLGGTQMTARLYRFEECDKFRKYKSGTMFGPGAPSFDPKKPKLLIGKAIEVEHAEKALHKAIKSGVADFSELVSTVEDLKRELNEMFCGEENDTSIVSNGCGDIGMKAFTTDLRSEFKGLDDIFVWHALCGAWGGVRTSAAHLDSKIVPVTVSPGLDGIMQDLAVVKIVEGGIGLVQPDQAIDFYDSMHSYLAEAGITGVKVDDIHLVRTLDYVSYEYGGRVELAKAYYDGLSRSVAKNFNGTELISSMQQCNDFFFLGTKQISIRRVGDDFWFQDPNGDPMGVYWLQGVHMIHCAYNSMWMGQIIQPHCSATFHAGSRAICGGPVYVSDSVGGHNFDLIKKLVFPDGTIPKCQHFALPSRDCLFKNPLFVFLSIFFWYGGVVGAFNCQGAGRDPKEQRIKGYSKCYKPMTGSRTEAYEMGEAEEFASFEMTVEPSSFEIFSFVPVKKLKNNTRFAPFGFTGMFNCGGTIQETDYLEDEDDQVCVKIKRKVTFDYPWLAYSSSLPKKCFMNGVNEYEVGFEWFTEDGKLTSNLPWLEEYGGESEVSFVFLTFLNFIILILYTS